MSRISWNRKIMLKFKRNFKEKKLTSSMMFDVYLIIVSKCHGDVIQKKLQSSKWFKLHSQSHEAHYRLCFAT